MDPISNCPYICTACLAAINENQARVLANPQAVEERYQFSTLLEAFLAHVERSGVFAVPTVFTKAGFRPGHMGLTFAEEIEGIQQGIAVRRFTPVYPFVCGVGGTPKEHAELPLEILG